MSRPYQFSGDNTPASPLYGVRPLVKFWERLTRKHRDRQQNQAPKPPPSFKTNVNRMKTKKWVEAKSYSYEGDDWGEYDEDDEYGVGSPSSAQATSSPTGPRQQGQGISGGAARSFTNPEPPLPAQGPRRTSSFDTGDERRAFSSGAPPGQQPPLHVQTNVPPEKTGSRQASAASYAASNVSDISSPDPRKRVNYSPSAEPPPLQTRASPIPQASAQYPPHRSSQDQQRSPTSSVPPSAGGIPPRELTPTSASKPFPFIRPADIYKRMEEEREKERRSMDSQRSTPDITAHRTSEDSGSSGQVPRERTSMDSISRGSGRRTPLDTVAETTEQEGQPRSMLPPVVESSPPSAKASTTVRLHQDQDIRQPRPSGPPQLSNVPQLPQFGGESTFGDDFWGATPLGESKDFAAPALTAVPPQSTAARAEGGLQHAPSLGFRSLVNQAFDQPARSATGMSHQDSQRSAGDSSVSRSDSAATSDISPIMSRVPSSAAGTARTQEAQRREEATPTIAEEPTEVAAPEPQRRSDATLAGVHQIARKPSPAHSRNSSTDAAAVKPGYRRDLSTPSPNNSPARSPAVEANKQLPDPEVAELAMNSSSDETGAQIMPSTLDTAATENGNSHAANTGATTEPSILPGSTPQAQNVSLESGNKDLPLAPVETGSRPTSPSKGKVRDLAEKFDAESRKNSPVGTPRSSSPVKQEAVVEPSLPVEEKSALPPGDQPNIERPAAERELSFRPKLPGQWDSFASSVPQQSEDEEIKETPHTTANEPTETTPTASQHAIAHTETEKTPASPTAPIQSLADQSSPTQDGHPMAALAAAGAAMGEAIKKSVGLGESEAESPKSPTRAVGDVYNSRPMAPERLESDLSTVSPTPPQKDSAEPDEEEDIPPPVPLKERGKSPEYTPKSPLSPVRPAIITNISTDDAPTDLESDRLRKEIVRSLSPVEPSTSVESAQQGLTADSGDNAVTNRDSSILPQIYDSYWGSDKEVAAAEHSPTVLPEASEPIQGTPQGPVESNIEAPAEKELAPAPSSLQPSPLIKRFSWEIDDSKPMSPASPASAEATAPAGPSTEGQASLAIPGDKTPDNPRFSGEGLHVINAAPGEIPQIDTSTTAARQSEDSPQTVQDISPVANLRTAPAVATTGGIDPKFPSFREIMAIKSPDQRIANFNATREQWAGHDSGLSAWLASTMTAHPEHVNLASFDRPLTSGPTGARHKATSSISRAFTKQFSPITGQSQQDFGSQQQSAGGTSQGASPSGPQRTSGVKGKDLLEKAGALGGKGMTGAKGLFAKGRSKIRGSIGGSEKAIIPSPPRAQQAPQVPLDLETSSFAPTLQKRHSNSSKRSSRSFSPFHRSRPSSVVVPDSGHEIPEIPAEALPGAKSRRSSRSFSPFRRSRPSSIVVPDRANFIPDVPTEPLPEGIGPKSFPAAQAPWEHRNAPESGTTTPSRLGVLPSPAREAFSRGNDAVGTTEEQVLQSIIRHASPVSAEKGSSNLLSVPNLDQKAEGANGHQRVVSLIGPEEMQRPSTGQDEPVSPVSPVEDADVEDKHPEDQTAPEQAMEESPTTPKASQQPQSTSQAEEEIDHDRESTDSWERDSSEVDNESGPDGLGPSGTSVEAENVQPDRTDLTPVVASGKATTTSDSQEIIDEASSNEQTDAERMPATADHGGIALSERATQDEAEPSARDDDHVSLTFEEPVEDEYLNQEPELSNVARQMEMKNEVAGSPTDELYERPPTPPQRPVMTVTTAEGEKDEQEDDDDTPTNANTLGPSQSTTARSMPSVSSVGKSEQDEDNKDMLGPSQSTAARSMPSVSSMGHEDGVSSAGDENVDPARPAVSPIPPSFMDREYKAPDPNRERPMSFVPLPRDPSGRPPQEEITVRTPRAGEPEAQRWEPSPPQQADSGEKTPEAGARPSPLQDVTKRSPEQPSPGPRNTHGDQLGQRGVAEEQDEQGGYFRGVPNLRRTSGQGLSPPAFQPRLGDPRKMGPGQLPVMPPGSQSPAGPRAPQNKNGPGLLQPAYPAHTASHQSVETQNAVTDKKKRSSGLLSAFKRPPSTGAESTFSRGTSILAQATDSPTRAQYLQNPDASVGVIPPASPAEDGKKQKLSKKDLSKLQRSSTTQAQDSGKKKRFSALGSIFGRSGTTGHTPKAKLEKKNQPTQTMVHHLPPNAAPSAFESMQQYQIQRSSRDRDLPPLPREAHASQRRQFTGTPPPPGGYYAPANAPASGIPTDNPSRQYGPGVVNYAHLSQQQAIEQRQREIDARNRSLSVTSGRTPFRGRDASDSSAHLSPQISAGASPMDYRSQSLGAMSSVSSISSSRRESAPSPYGPGPGPPYPPGHAPRMGSITESHQERPWAIFLPVAEQEDDSEVEAAEIMRAASARWQRPSATESDEPLLTTSPSQRQATSGATQTRWREVDAEELYGLQAQEIARQQAAEQEHQLLGTMPQYRYHHSRQPTQQLLLQQREQYEYWQQLHRQKQLQEQAQRLAYAEAQARAEQQRQQQQQPALPPEQLRYREQEQARHTPPAADANPAIPPLPQAPIAMHQPQPQRMPYSSAGARPGVPGVVGDPRLEESFRSGSRDRNVGVVGAAEESVADETARAEEEPETKLHVVNDTVPEEEGGAVEEEANEEEEGEGEQTGDETEEEIPPPSRDSEAHSSEHSDDMPQMKAVSYPGDEWMPRWDID